MVDKLDYLYAMLDDLDDDLSSMQEDLEMALELIDEGEVNKARIILAEMNNFLIDFLEPEECDDEECECHDMEEPEQEKVKEEKKSEKGKKGKKK